MRFAYADPPYLGCGNLYAKHHPEAKVWNDISTHGALIDRLVAEYPDGWVLSLHAPSLRHILPLCPNDVRIGAYCKTFAQIRKGVGANYFWEPVIWRGGRGDTGAEHRRDWVAAFPRNGAADGLIGGKPRDFSRWIFWDLLGAIKGDTFDDIFPGTGAVGRAWAEYIGESEVPEFGLFGT